MPSYRPLNYILASAFLVIIIVLGYSTPRHETGSLMTCYFLLFACYLLVIRKHETLDEDEANFWIIASLLFRAALLFSIPALSDDFYRFIWDGRVLAAGANPYAQVPSYYMDHAHTLPGLDDYLYGKLNSQHRFSSYPPLCQFIYWMSVKLAPDSIHGSVLMMKNLLFLFEIGTIWLIKRLVIRMNIPRGTVLIYAINPLVIIEIAGNVHFEGIMIFFLIGAIHLVMSNRLILSTTAYALSVCTKLIPLIVLPMLIHPLKKGAIKYWALTGIIVILLYVPLYQTEIIHGYTTSLGYYFQRFEFNASIYYLIRALGYIFFGFNIIQFAGPLLAITAAALILKMTFRPWGLRYSGEMNDQIFKGMVWCLFIYFLSSPIVHPWYIITLLALSVFAGYRFIIVWSGLIFLTYAGYTETGYEEHLWIVTLEYVVLILFAFIEVVWRPQTNHS